jgi:hypothetical protein
LLGVSCMPVWLAVGGREGKKVAWDARSSTTSRDRRRVGRSRPLELPLEASSGDSLVRQRSPFTLLLG